MYGPQPRLHPTRSCSIPPASPHSRAPWQHPAPTTAAAGYLKRPRDTDAVVREDRGFRGYVGKCQSNSRSIVLQLKTSVIRSSKLTPKIGGLRKQHGGGCEHQQYGANWAHHVWTKPHFWTNPHGKSPSLHLGFLAKKNALCLTGFHKVFWLQSLDMVKNEGFKNPKWRQSNATAVLYPSKFESQIFATVKLMSLWWNWRVREQDLGFRCKKTDTINNMYGKAFRELWVSYTFFRVLLFSLKVHTDWDGWEGLAKVKKNAEAWFVSLPPKRWITFDPKIPLDPWKNDPLDPIESH